MKKQIIANLDSILEYYKETYTVSESIEEIRNELVYNNVEVNGDSFYCPIWNEEHQSWILLAGTKETASLWVLKRIVKLIKSGDTILTMFNGNSEYLVSAFSRYNIKVIHQEKDISYISFN
jgi:hypothetical protein